MNFRILGLDPASFVHLYGASDEYLRSEGVIRRRVDAANAYPDRIEVRDAEPGHYVLLLNHLYLDTRSPYRGRHAIYVAEGATRRCDVIDEVPPALGRRLLSLRGFDAEGMLVDADIVEGRELPTLAERLFADDRVAFIHAHHAKQGCYAARIERA